MNKIYTFSSVVFEFSCCSIKMKGMKVTGKR